jgi:hypothetical protein
MQLAVVPRSLHEVRKEFFLESSVVGNEPDDEVKMTGIRKQMKLQHGETSA